MSRRTRANRVRHEFSPELSWDESALVCRRCSQYRESWQHEPRVPWWKFWAR